MQSIFRISCASFIHQYHSTILKSIESYYNNITKLWALNKILRENKCMKKSYINEVTYNAIRFK